MVIVLVGVILYGQQTNRKMIDDTFGVYCPDCNRNNWMGERDCYNCTNCGWCIDPNGNGSCGIGSASGPMFKDCRSWYYNGQCMWGPDCGSVGPIYYNNYYWDRPWYNNWWYWGWGGPRRHYRRARPWRRALTGRKMNRVALRRNRRMIAGGRRGRRAGSPRGRGGSPRGRGGSPRRGGGRRAGSPRRGGGRRR